MKKTAITALLVALSLAFGSARAQDALTLEQAVSKIKQDARKKKGVEVHVLSAGEVEVKGRRMYRVKILDEGGRVRSILVDPKP